MYSSKAKPAVAATNILDIAWDREFLYKKLDIYRVYIPYERGLKDSVYRDKRVAIQKILRVEAVEGAPIMAAYRAYGGRDYQGMYLAFEASRAADCAVMKDSLKEATGRAEACVESIDIRDEKRLSDVLLANLLLMMVPSLFGKSMGRSDEGALFCAENEVYYRMGDMLKRVKDFGKNPPRHIRDLSLDDSYIAEVWALALTAKSAGVGDRALLSQRLVTFTDKAVLRSYFDQQPYIRMARLKKMKLGLDEEELKKANPVDYVPTSYVLDGVSLRRAREDERERVLLPMVSNTCRSRTSLDYLVMNGETKTSAGTTKDGLPIYRDGLLHSFLDLANDVLAGYGVSFSFSDVDSCDTIYGNNVARKRLKKDISDYSQGREFSIMLSGNIVEELTPVGFMAAAGADADREDVLGAWMLYKTLEREGTCFVPRPTDTRIAFIHDKNHYRWLSRKGLDIDAFVEKSVRDPEFPRIINLHVLDPETRKFTDEIPEQVAASLAAHGIRYVVKDVEESDVKAFYVKEGEDGEWRMFSRLIGDMSDILDIHDVEVPGATVQHVTYETLRSFAPTLIAGCAPISDHYALDKIKYRNEIVKAKRDYKDRFLLELEAAADVSVPFERAEREILESGYLRESGGAKAKKSLLSIVCVALRDMQFKADVLTHSRKLGFEGDDQRDLLEDWAYFAMPLFKSGNFNQIIFAEAVDVMKCSQDGGIEFERMEWLDFQDICDKLGVEDVDSSISAPDGAPFVRQADCPEIICVARNGAVVAAYDATDLIVVSRNISKMREGLSKGSVRSLKGGRDGSDVSYLDCLDGFIGIKSHLIGGECFYSVGETDSLNQRIDKAVHLRRVVQACGPELDLHDFVKMLMVGFVRHNRATVRPFPAKYIREWRRLEKLTDRVDSFESERDSEDDELNDVA